MRVGPTNHFGIAGWLCFLVSLCVVACIWIAWPSKYYFLNDDFEHIYLAANGHFLYGNLMRPVADVLLWTEHFLWGNKPFGYHAVNLILHLADTMLVFLVSRTLLLMYSEGKSMVKKASLAALIFLIYGVHSEPVFWIIGCASSLGALFFLIALHAYLRREKMGYFVLSLVCLIAGLFTYESVWVFPILALSISAIDAHRKKCMWRNEWMYPVIVAICFFLVLISKSIFFGGIGSDYTLHNIYFFNLRILLTNYNALLARTFLCPMANTALFVGCYATAVAFIILCIAYLRRNHRTSMLLILMLFSYLVSCLPAVSLGINIHNSESERYVYLPSFFFILFLVELVCLIGQRKAFRVVIYVIFVCAHLYLFSKVARTYQFAGRVVRKSMAAIATINFPVQTIHLVHRPLRYAGAIIFRSDFRFPLELNCPNLKYGQIDTVSTYLYSNEVPFRTEKIALPLGLNFLKGSARKIDGNAIEIKTKDESFSFDENNDIIFFWTDSTFLIIK